MIYNNLYNTKRLNEFTQKRNNKVNDFLHKVSKYIVEIAKTYNICKIMKKESVDIEYKGFDKINKISNIVKYQKSLKVKKPKKAKKPLKMHAE